MPLSQEQDDGSPRKNDWVLWKEVGILPQHRVDTVLSNTSLCSAESTARVGWTNIASEVARAVKWFPFWQRDAV